MPIAKVFSIFFCAILRKLLKIKALQIFAR